MARRARDFDGEGSESVLAKRHCEFSAHGQVYPKLCDEYVELSSYEDMVRYWCVQENIVFNILAGKAQISTIQ
jgi:hypothetical protein